MSTRRLRTIGEIAPASSPPHLTGQSAVCIFNVDTSKADMRTKVQRWGNSLAVRIPKAFAQEIGLEESSPIDLAVTDGQLVLSLRRSFRLDELLEGVTEENLHREVESGPAVGDEVW